MPGCFNFDIPGCADECNFSKRMGGYIHKRLPGVLGTESPSYISDGMEDETEIINWLDREEDINGMGSGDSINVCNSNKSLKGYKDWVGDWIV